MIFFFNPLFKIIVTVVLPVLLPAARVQVPLGFPETFTTFVLPDFQDATESPFARPLTLKTVVFCFIFNRSFVAFTFIVGVSFLPLFLVSLRPHILQIRVCSAGAKTVAAFVVRQEEN